MICRVLLRILPKTNQNWSTSHVQPEILQMEICIERNSNDPLKERMRLLANTKTYILQSFDILSLQIFLDKRNA